MALDYVLDAAPAPRCSDYLGGHQEIKVGSLNPAPSCAPSAPVSVTSPAWHGHIGFRVRSLH